MLSVTLEIAAVVQPLSKAALKAAKHTEHEVRQRVLRGKPPAVLFVRFGSGDGAGRSLTRLPCTGPPGVRRLVAGGDLVRPRGAQRVRVVAMPTIGVTCAASKR